MRKEQTTTRYADPPLRACAGCDQPLATDTPVWKTFCSWKCMLAAKERGAYLNGYRAGALDAIRLRSAVPPEVWAKAIRLAHPDRHHGTADERDATIVTRWLLEARPIEAKV